MIKYKLNILWLDLFDFLTYSKKTKLLSLVDKNQDITETFAPTMKFWAVNEKAQATGERNVKMVYGKYGFLTSTNIEDARSTYNFDFGSAERYYTSYYTTADFNVVVPHVYGK